MMEEKFLQEVLDRLLTLHEDLQHRAKDATDPSRKNLYRYLRLRGFDLTQLQGDLARVGLSSLGRSHGCIQNAVEKNIYILQRLLDQAPMSEFDPLDYDKAARIALENTKIFEQNSKDDRFKTKIMVTLPGIAAYDEKLIDNLVKSYASVLRINTAHDGPKEWAMMAQKIKQANIRHNREVKIYVDLAGPKNRTGPIQKVFTPFKIGSKKDPKPVRLVGPQHQTMPVSANAHDFVQAFLSVSSDFLDVAGHSDSVEVYDPIKQKSFLFALQRDSEGIFFYASKKVNITKDTGLKIIDYKDRYESNLHNFLLTPEAVRLYTNDRIIIAKPPVQGQSEYEYKGSVYEAIISCSNEAIFDHVKKGHKVFIDDGKIGCRVEAIDEIGLICRVETAKPKGQVLKETKGLNFPDTDLEIDAITQEDKLNFEHTVEFADIYGLSFAQSAKDVQTLQSMLRDQNSLDTAVVAKIETKPGFANLPSILDALLDAKQAGVMIARGDLAIEAGFENMAYIQEQIFEMCEAAHMPVIYATQILEGKMKKNLPSRAEITDAAYAQRADCVMLNKGPYVIETLQALKSILRTMHLLFEKNRPLFSQIKTF